MCLNFFSYSENCMPCIFGSMFDLVNTKCTEHISANVIKGLCRSTFPICIHVHLKSIMVLCMDEKIFQLTCTSFQQTNLRWLNNLFYISGMSINPQATGDPREFFMKLMLDELSVLQVCFHIEYTKIGTFCLVLLTKLNI